MNCYNEFACIKEDIQPTRLNKVAAGEHIGDVERSGRTVKECTRCHVHRNPYKRYPKVMVPGFMVKSVKDLNHLPPENGTSNDLIPDSIVTGRPVPNHKEGSKLILVTTYMPTK